MIANKLKNALGLSEARTLQLVIFQIYMNYHGVYFNLTQCTA